MHCYVYNLSYFLFIVFLISDLDILVAGRAIGSFESIFLWASLDASSSFWSSSEMFLSFY